MYLLMNRAALSRAVAAWLLIVPMLMAAAIFATPHAQAQPFATDVPDTAKSLVTLPWKTLGLPSSINFPYIDQNQDYNVPLPTGLTPVRLRGLIQPPVNLGPGNLAINDSKGTFLASIPFPAMGPGLGPIPLDVDLSGARLGPTSFGLSFTVRQFNAADGLCGPKVQLNVTDLVTDFTGAEPPPTTIATMFPRFLQRVTLYAPTDADKGEQQAVLTLASALALAYQPEPVVITTVSQPRGATPPPAGPMARAIIVERGPARLTVTNPGAPEVYLRVSGRDDELSNQASFVVNQLQSLVQNPSAKVDQAGSRRLPSGDTFTFEQLNIKARAEVLGPSGLSVGVDRAELGASRIASMKVHLLATYTPVSTNDAATVMVSTDGQALYTAALDTSGKLDTNFTLPADGQRISLDFALAYTPRMLCTPIIAPMTFEVDPASTLALQRGGPAPGGFSALPSEFSPGFIVGIDGSSPDQLSYATRVIVSIARETSAPLTPRVVDIKSAAESPLSALIVANSATLKKTLLNPPVAGEGSSINVDLPTQLRADIVGGLGSIQVFADTPRNRTVLLITTTDTWNLVNPLPDYIDGLSGGWKQLTGDVLAAGGTGTPTNLTIRSDNPALAQDKAGNTKLWIGMGAGAAVLLIAGVAGALLRRRRKGASDAPPPVESG